jgi:hypothetical protein
MLRITKKPPVGKSTGESLEVIVQGNHMLDRKLCQLFQVITLLEIEGFSRAGEMLLNVPLLDEADHILTHFADGRLIGECRVISEGPYDCAADNYDRRTQFMPPHRAF